MIEHALKAVEVILKLRPTRQTKLLIETRVFLKQIGPSLFGTLDMLGLMFGVSLSSSTTNTVKALRFSGGRRGKRKHSTYVLCRRNRS